MATSNPIVTNLNTYIEQHKSDLMLKTYMSPNSVKHLNLMVDVKGQTTLNLLDVAPTLQADACGWNESGDITASQRILNPAFLKVNMALCDKKLLNTYKQHEVKVAAGLKNDPFEAEVVEGIINGVAEQTENMIWQGVSGATSCDGYLAILDAAQTAGLITFGSATGMTAYNKIKAAYLAAPAKITEKSDCKIFVGLDTYAAYMQDLVAANLYHYNPEDGENEYKLPGTKVSVVGVAGLTLPSTGKTIGSTTFVAPVVIARESNLVYGIAEDGDSQTLDGWYSKDNGEFRFAVEFGIGTQIAYPNEVTVVNG